MKGIIVVLTALLASVSAINPGGNDTIVQMFEWNWKSVARECPLLRDLGYGWVQVSPPQESRSGDQWWTAYQALSYTITGRRGERQDFIDMINACHAVGIKVLVDTIINHMAGSGGGSTVDGKYWSHFDYPSVNYTKSDFHHYRGISDWSSEFQIWNYELAGLADLNTTLLNVQKRVGQYMTDLQSMGVDGLRIDAAKHVNPKEILAMLSYLPKPFEFITNEVVYDETCEVKPDIYREVGTVMCFPGTWAFNDLFMNPRWGQGIVDLVHPTLFGEGWGNGFYASNVSNLFVACHDTERGGAGGGLSYKSRDNAYVLAHAFAIGFNYSTFTVLSGYNWTVRDDGAPGSWNHADDVICGQNGWRCDHRQPWVANLIAFRNAAREKSVSHVQHNGKGTNVVAFGREDLGFFIINHEKVNSTRDFDTGLAPGFYCDIVNSVVYDNKNCSGNMYKIDAEGKFRGDVPPHTAIALWAQ